MSTFTIVYFVALLFQIGGIGKLKKAIGPIWGRCVYSYLAFPTWAAVTFAGTLGIGPGLILFVGSVALFVIAIIVLGVRISMKDPLIMENISKPEYKLELDELANSGAAVAGLFLLIASVAGAMALG